MWVMDEIMKRHDMQKRLAIVLVLLMVLGLLSDSALQVKAEDEVVVITVNDVDGAPVEGASVSYKISQESAGAVAGDSVTDGDVSVPSPEITGSDITDAEGKIAIAISPFVEEMTISLEVLKEGFGKRTVPKQPLEANIVVSFPRVQALNGVYNKEDQDLVSVSCSNNLGDEIRYSTDGDNWQGDVPTEKAAGEYSVYVQMLREGAELFHSGELTAIINKAEPELRFVEEPTADTVDFDWQGENTYNFSVSCNDLLPGDISYCVQNVSRDDETDIEAIASFEGSGEEAGVLTIKRPGHIIRIKATAGETENYTSASKTYVLAIRDTSEDLIRFGKSEVSFTLGMYDENTISEQAAEKSHEDDNGAVTYEGKVTDFAGGLEDIGIELSDSGRVSLKDLELLSDAIGTKESLAVVITATKEGGSKEYEAETREVYAGCQAEYTILLSTEKKPEEGYTKCTPENEIILSENLVDGWYNTVVILHPADGYMIARDKVTNEFGDSVVFGDEEGNKKGDQGVKSRIIYLKNEETGGITAPITIDLEKLDNEKPYDVHICFPESDQHMQDGVMYYDNGITIKFTAKDDTSGVGAFCWTYVSCDGPGNTMETVSDKVEAVQGIDEDGSTIYTAFLTLPGEEKEEGAQLRGHLEVFARDVAGNESDILQDDRFFVVDTIPPLQSVSYGLRGGDGNCRTVGTKHYFSGPVDFVFHITEANFFEDDVHITVSKDGGQDKEQTVPWNSTDVEGEHVARLTLDGDGDYVVSMTYTDRSGNEMSSYTSETIVVDTTAPVIEFYYDDDYSGENAQTATITVTEHNFRQSDIEVTAEAKTITDQVVEVEGLNEYLKTCQWVHEGDVHRAYLSSQFADAIYVLTLNYKDLAQNQATEVRTEQFVVDHTPPDRMSVSYFEPIKETILSAITLGFYNPTVTVEFTAYDYTAGADYFTWSYIRQEGVSEENVELYGETRVKAVQDSEDKAKFTASITLPKEQAQQLRGMIAFTATDKCGNKSDALTDSGHVLVVDTISPVITAEYTSPDDTSGGKLYYSKALMVTFTVTEANFFSEDVIVMRTKDEEVTVQVEPVWTDISADVHVGTCVIEAPDDHENDGEYVFTVSYTDRSDNTMEVFISKVLVVDTTPPEQNVSYSLRDADGNCQTVGSNHYFSGPVDFVFHITEANFLEKDVHITVSKDRGQDQEQTVTWNSTDVEGEHVAGLTLDGDGDYVVNMTYTDRCGHEMPSYTSETIVVDATAPVIEFYYDDDYSGENAQTATITVTEHNFCQSNIEVTTEAKTITDLAVEVEDLNKYLKTCQWVHEGDVHRAYLSSQFADAIYVLTLNYKDLAQNQATKVRTEPFVVDHTPPSTDRMSVSYSTSIKDTILSVITLGFYNPSVTVTFTAYDDTAGVDYFTWSYMRQEGVSEENVERYEKTRVKAVQDSGVKAKFTAYITLPKEQAQQLRGMIAFTATDKCGNESGTLTDSGHVLVVDTISPVITAEYTSPDDTSGGKLYYNKALTVTFTVTEANFFSEDVIVMRTKDEEVTVQVEPVWTDISADVHVGTCVIEAPDNHENDGEYVFTVSYTDRSDNTMEVFISKVLVVDTTPPEQNVSFGLGDAGGSYQPVGTRHYFSAPVDVVFHITETNFFAEDVQITVSKDGGQDREQTVTWNSTDVEGEHVAGLTLDGDGDYVVSMTYTDRCGHEMPPYTSETIVVDATAPVIEFQYADYSGETPQTATITVTEHNFRQSDIEVATKARTITDLGVSVEDLQNYLRNCQWVHEEDVHRAYLSDQFADAIYVLTCNYKDLALNQATEIRTEQFVVDHTSPSTDRMSVSYSAPIKDTILSVITLGFYNPTVTVTFTAYDDTAGVDYFTWSYMRQEGVSEENVERYGETQIAAVQDPVDKAKFTASITLPGERAQQLRGMIVFTATDRYGNVSDKVTDSGHVLVVDTISPVITAEYTTPDNTFGGKLYYNKALTATFTVTEANFFSEDVIVMLTKDNEEPVQATPVWTDISADVHVGTYVIEAPDNHAGDGDYVFTVNYTDKSDNTMGVYTSDVFVIDTILPVIEVEYSDKSPVNTLADFQGITRPYFPAELSATLTITEHNFNSEQIDYIITATDVAGNELNAEALYRSTGWTSNEDVNTVTIIFPGDANYSFDIEYIDLALHEMADYPTDYFTVDISMPDSPEISYSTSVLDTILANISFGFYNAPMTVRVTAVDRISGVHGFDYSYLRAEGVSTVNAELAEQPIEESQISFSDGGATATASFQISQAALAAGNQFNGTVNVSATDRAGNQTDYLRDVKRIVVDNIAPTATVEYNVPVQEVNNISYYDGDINATITVNEANFYSEDVTVAVTRDGASYAVTPVWNDNSTDVHTGTFTLTGDGDYFVEITYSDKSANDMQQYMSEQMTIDTQIEEAVITVNGMEADGKAFKDEVVLAVSFEDTNFEDYEILLTRTSFASKNIDVTEQFIGEQITTNAFGGSGSFDTFSRIAENDGIYTVTVNLSDRAGHTVEKTAIFTVNRYGSVYEYSDYLVDLINDGGAYVQKVEEDLIITEYNADRLVSQSLNIEISRDGKPLDSSDYKVTPEISDVVETGDKGWYQYQYTISKDNFSADGVYKISVSSIDQTGNTPENTNYQNKAILFRVDSTAPEINSITGLESAIVNATSLEINYTIYDTIGLESVAVYVDGKEKDDIIDFAGDVQNYFGSLLLVENPQAQKVRLVVRDLAGNVTDTDAENFISAFAFSSAVTISTNALVRWYANKMLFWGSIGGVVAVVGAGVGIIILLVRRRRRKTNAQ